MNDHCDYNNKGNHVEELSLHGTRRQEPLLSVTE